MSEPLSCVSCGGPRSFGSSRRCRACYTIGGRLVKIVKDFGPLTEDEIAKHFLIESCMRQLELAGKIRETPNGWRRNA